MAKNLFTDFKVVSAKQWKQKIQVDLKGKDYADLISHSNDYIDIKPFYHQDEAMPSLINADTPDWKIYESINIHNSSDAISTINEALTKGAEALWLHLETQKTDLLEILQKIDFQHLHIFIEFSFFDKDYFLTIAEFLKNTKHHITLGVDIIGHLAKTGNWHHSLNNDFAALKELLTNDSLPLSLSIDTSHYQNAGANHVQQLAYAMAHVNDYLNIIANEIPDQLSNFTPLFKVAVGGDYFFEIAKLKALRCLYNTLSEAYECPTQAHILAFPTRRNKTIYDYNINLLRTTTECMSAILGGADGVCNAAYDKIYHHDNAFGTRIARNQLLILKEESYFDKVTNPADGSYYLESLVRQMTEKGLELFKSIEKGGGFLKQLKIGKIQQKIQEEAKKEQRQFDNGEKILVGTNHYKNDENRMKGKLERNPFLKKNPRKTLIAPIIAKRLAEKIEQERLRQETDVPS